jgi:hypothetical protein
MARKKTPNKPSQPAATPRQVALVLPHASAAAGPSFETALETLSSDLAVHKLWQANVAGKPAKK